MKVLFCILCVLFLSCLSAQAQSSFLVSLDSLKNGAQIYLSQDQLLIVKAYSNPSTGYKWAVDYDKKDIELIEEKYVSDVVPEGWVGVGGHMFFTFKNKDKSFLSFIYSRGNDKGSSKKIYIMTSKLRANRLLGSWFQTQHQELVVRDGEKYPYQNKFSKGDHSFTFNANQTGVCRFKNTETGLFEKVDFKWTFNKHQLVINYVGGANVQDAMPEEYTITLQGNEMVLESMEKDDDKNYIYNKLVLTK